MEGAARILLDGVAGASRGERIAAKAALESAAIISSKEDADAIRIAGNALKDAETGDRVASALRTMMHEAGSAGAVKATAVLDEDAIESVRLLRGSNVADILTKEELASLERIAGKVANRFPDAVLQATERFSRSEELSLIEALSTPRARLLFNDTTYTRLAAEADAGANETITKIVRETSAKEPRLARAMKRIYSGAKVAVVGGAATYCAVWMASYMKRSSGPFVIHADYSSLRRKLTQSEVENHKSLPTKRGAPRRSQSTSSEKLNASGELKKLVRKARIRDPYPCGFSDKSGDETHPLDAIIRTHVPNPCTDWKSWDACGGWTALHAQSRLAQILEPAEFHAALHSLRGSKLSCEDTSLQQAFVALVHEAGHTVGGVLRASAVGVVEGLGINFSTFIRVACAIGSMIAGAILFRVVRGQGVSMPFSLFAAFVGSALIFTFACVLQSSSPHEENEVEDKHL